MSQGLIQWMPQNWEARPAHSQCDVTELCQWDAFCDFYDQHCRMTEAHDREYAGGEHDTGSAGPAAGEGAAEGRA